MAKHRAKVKIIRWMHCFNSKDELILCGIQIKLGFGM